MALLRLMEQDEGTARIVVVKEKQKEVDGPIFEQWTKIQAFVWGVLLKNCQRDEEKLRPRESEETDARRALSAEMRRDYDRALRAEQARIRRELEEERRRRLREEMERRKREREEARRRREELRKKRREEARRRREQLEEERRRLPPHLRAELDRVRRKIGVSADGCSGDKAAQASAEYRAMGGDEVRHGLLDFAARLIVMYRAKKGDVVDELCENMRFPPGKESLASRRSSLALVANALVANPDVAEAFGTSLAELLVLRQYTQKPIDFDRDLGFDDVPPPPKSGEDAATRTRRELYERRYNNWDWAESQVVDGVPVACRNGSIFGPVCAALRDQGPGGSRGAWSEQILQKWIKWTCLVAAVCCSDTDDCADPDDELWRGLGGGGLPGFVVENHRKFTHGDLLGWPALSSTSFDEEASKEYMWGVAVNSTGKPNPGRPGTILFRIHGIRTGKVLQPLSQYPAERELLLGPLTVFRIEKCNAEPRNPFQNDEGHTMGLNIVMTCMGPTGAPLRGTELGEFFSEVRRDADEAGLKLSLSAAADAAGWTPLHGAAADAALDLIHDLLDAGADPSSSATDGTTPLHVAAQNAVIEATDAGLEVLRRLAPRKALHAADGNGLTPLAHAARSGNLAALKCLASLGASPECADSVGRHPLHYLVSEACCAGDDDPMMIASIRAIAPDTSLMQRDAAGATPLALAILSGRVNTVQTLLSYPASLRATPDALHLCAMHEAFDQGGGYESVWRQAVRTLAATGNSLRMVNAQGYTALECAVRARRTHLVGELLRAGADSTPLFANSPRNAKPQQRAQRNCSTTPVPLPADVPMAREVPLTPIPPPGPPSPPPAPPPQDRQPTPPRTALARPPPGQPPSCAPIPVQPYAYQARKPTFTRPAADAPPPTAPVARPSLPAPGPPGAAAPPNRSPAAPGLAAPPPPMTAGRRFSAKPPAASRMPQPWSPSGGRPPPEPPPARDAAQTNAGAPQPSAQFRSLSCSPTGSATSALPQPARYSGAEQRPARHSNPEAPQRQQWGGSTAAARLAALLEATPAPKQLPPAGARSRSVSASADARQRSVSAPPPSQDPPPIQSRARPPDRHGVSREPPPIRNTPPTHDGQGRLRSPPRISTSPTSTSMRDRLIRIFEHYDRAQLPTVVATLRDFAGHEGALFEALRWRYGPEPEAVEPPPMPPGWRRVETSRGHVFYQDKAGRKQWGRPRPPIAIS